MSWKKQRYQRTGSFWKVGSEKEADRLSIKERQYLVQDLFLGFIIAVKADRETPERRTSSVMVTFSKGFWHHELVRAVWRHSW